MHAFTFARRNINIENSNEQMIFGCFSVTSGICHPDRIEGTIFQQIWDPLLCKRSLYLHWQDNKLFTNQVQISL